VKNDLMFSESKYNESASEVGLEKTAVLTSNYHFLAFRLRVSVRVFLPRAV